jgi:hypothetical protein
MAKRNLDKLPPSILRALLRKGGTVGQVFVKNSDEDYDYGWQNPGNIPNGFQGQAVVTWLQDYDYFVLWPIFFLNNQSWPAGTATVTLSAADATFDRLDIIAVNAAGAVVIPGTPSATPVKATVDNLTQLEITTILVGAGTTEPSEVTDLDVYKENVEFVGSSDIAGADFANTSGPFAGTKCVDIGSFTAGKYIKFVDGSTHDASEIGTVKFYIKLKATFTPVTGLIISFFNGVSPISSEFTITQGIYSFDGSDISGYQLIAIPMSEFTFSSAIFDTFYIKTKGSNSTGFKLDNIILQGGISGARQLQNTLTTIQTDSGTNAVADRPNDIFNFTGGEGSAVQRSAPKTLRWLPLPTLALAGTDTYTVTYNLWSTTPYPNNATYKMYVANTNTGTPPETINISGAGAKALKDNSGNALTPGALVVGAVYIINYKQADGFFRIINLGGGGSGSGTVNSGAQYRIPYYSTNPTGTVLDAAAAITANKIVTSDANGLLVGSYDFIDDDTFATASATNIPSAESVKEYVDASAGGGISLGASFDGMGAVILVNSIYYLRSKSAMTITGWSIVAEGSSPTCTIDIFKIATGTTLPSASICASALPALSTGNALKSTTLTGWTTSVAADDMLAFKVTACANATKIQIVLYP